MAKKEQKENNKNKKSFFKSFKAELKKVTWPTPKQLANNTVAVITIVLLTAIIVFALDLVFETINKQGMDRLKQMVSQNETTDENNTTNETPETMIIDDNTTNESSEGETTETQTPENATAENTTAETTNTENTTSAETTSNE